MLNHKRCRLVRHLFFALIAGISQTACPEKIVSRLHSRHTAPAKDEIMWNSLDFSQSPFTTRCLAMLGTLLVCIAISTVMAVGSMLLLAFSVDAGHQDDWLPRGVIITAGVGLGIVLGGAPVCVLLRVPAPVCYVPIVAGSLVTLCAVMQTVMRNVG